MEIINAENANALVKFTNIFEEYLSVYYDNFNQELIFLCIGTDRATGDSLGPLVGHNIKILDNLCHKTYVFGTLESPVHAKNLDTILDMIHSKFSNPFIVAIDASLGNPDKIGNIVINRGPIKPGAGINKNLGMVGDMYITGIVNTKSPMAYLLLQNTRLYTIVKMAEIISMGIKYVVFKHYKKPSPKYIFLENDRLRI